METNDIMMFFSGLSLIVMWLCGHWDLLAACQMRFLMEKETSIRRDNPVSDLFLHGRRDVMKREEISRHTYKFESVA